MLSRRGHGKIKEDRILPDYPLFKKHIAQSANLRCGINNVESCERGGKYIGFDPLGKGVDKVWI